MNSIDDDEKMFLITAEEAETLLQTKEPPNLGTNWYFSTWILALLTIAITTLIVVILLVLLSPVYLVEFLIKRTTKGTEDENNNTNN